MTYDAAIIGGGPVGLITAHRLARNGHQVVVFEEHDKIGIPDHCAGLLSCSGLRRIGLSPPADVIQNTVRGARIYSPSGYELVVERGKREAYVVDRRKFDRWLGHRAEEKGVDIKCRHSVRNIRNADNGYHVQYSHEKAQSSIISKVVVNAEGVRGQIAGTFGLPRVPKKHKHPAYQYEVSNVEVDTEYVEMFYGSATSDGFFAWIIPIGEGRARVGLASRNHSKKRLQRAMLKHRIMSEHLKGFKVERGMGGVVLVGLPVSRFSIGGFLNIGDAAGMVKATTGGGVIIGGASANMAGSFISKVLEEGHGNPSLSDFDPLWKSVFHRELLSMYIAQKALTSLADKGIDQLVKGACETDIVEVIRDAGDMDLQRRVITRLLTNPKMLGIGLKAIRYLTLT